MQKLVVREESPSRLVLSKDWSERKSQFASYVIFFLVVALCATIAHFVNTAWDLFLVLAVLLTVLLALYKFVSMRTCTITLSIDRETRQITCITTIDGLDQSRVEWSFQDVAEIWVQWGGQREAHENEEDWVLVISKKSYADKIKEWTGVKTYDSSNREELARSVADTKANKMDVCEGQDYAVTLMLAEKLSKLIGKPIWDEWH